MLQYREKLIPMNTNYTHVVAGLFLFLSGLNYASAQTAQISGKIYTEELRPIELVSVHLDIPGQSFPTFITTKTGEYSFNNITVPADFTISAERNDNYRNGVSTQDMILIQKHLLGKQIITSPYKLIAADANNSKSVTAIDLIELRKLILGVYAVLPNNKSWRFVDKKFTFSDTSHNESSPSTITGTATGDIADADFIGIKIGDVNNTAKANFQSIITRDANKPFDFSIAQKLYEANEIVNIDFSIDDIKSLQGFQFTLSDTDLEFISASSNKIDLSRDDYALFGDKMTMSWFALDEVTSNPDDVVFTIKAIAKKAGNLQQSLQLNSDITDAELYSANDETFTPKIVIKTNDEVQLALMAPEPNPWSITCTIPFYLQKGGNLIFTVYDMNGANVFSKEKYYQAGYHEMELNSSDVNANGLLFYTIQNENESNSGKMILIK